MCKHDKSFNTGVQTSYLSSHERGFAKTSRAGGAPPHTDTLIGPATFGDVQKTDCLKRRACGAPSLFSLDSLELWNSWKLRFPFSRLRPPTRAGPLDAHLGTNHRRGSKTVPKPERSHEFDDCRGELSPMTSRNVSQQSFPEQRVETTWNPKQRTELTRENETKQEPALTTDSKYNKQSVFILTKLVNSIWTQ